MTAPFPPGRRLLSLGARLILGVIFVHLGITKALDPVGFLKLIRQFELVSSPPALNLLAAVLPWLEILCGVLLVFGMRVRAAALVVGVMLVVFTTAVALRAWSIYRAGGTPFCSIHFDCGCGTGEIVICTKLLQNVALGLLSGFVFSSASDPRTPLNPPTDA